MNTEPTEAHQMAYNLAVEAGMPKDGCQPCGPYTGPLFNAFAKYIANQQPAIAPELVAEMTNLVNCLSGGFYLHGVNDAAITPCEAVCTAKRIKAELDASKPDPLLEALQALVCDPVQFAPKVREHLALHGLHITEIEP